MSKLYNMERIVLSVLESNVTSRSDDYVLMCAVCEKVKPEILNYPFWLVMSNHKTNGLPTWETVTRCRRRIQRKRPDLVDRETAKIREAEEQEYREYARS